ncbi:hypothetical protein F0562_032765 [Nyssa sinensis]|uniref:GDT1 family protein n=1 Tax=Nyssa sinensis TaxID=561372 RepID=A0A5J5ASP1_9ASTE|nr:hypothetical protein F0562_032765 [Nyssa sinensis]
MSLSVAQGFTKSLAMTVLSEIGDKTFFAAAILAMRHPRRLILSGCLAALIVMTILSTLLGWAAPNLISRKFTHHITTLLFFGFGLWSLWDAFNDEGEAEELAEVEAKLDADLKDRTGKSIEINKANDELKKQRQPLLTQFFSPIFLKAFSVTFFGEWGDKSQVTVQEWHISAYATYHNYCCYVDVTLTVTTFSAGYHRFSSRSESIRCCSWWNHGTGFMYYCCCLGRKELGISDIGENSCTLRWSSFHYFWYPILPFNS